MQCFFKNKLYTPFNGFRFTDIRDEVVDFCESLDENLFGGPFCMCGQSDPDDWYMINKQEKQSIRAHDCYTLPYDPVRFFLK